jgi:putative acetyltransferase
VGSVSYVVIVFRVFRDFRGSFVNSYRDTPNTKKKERERQGMNLKRTTSDDPDFRTLVLLLDEFLAEVDGEEHAYYSQFNKLDGIPYAVVAYENERAVGCGAFRPHSPGIAEIKRMFVLPEERGKRVGAFVLEELESWASELGYTDCVLETGHKQEAAVSLYKRSGYESIPNYGQYTGVGNSICMKKNISTAERSTV